jgi:hypothetical protein
MAFRPCVPADVPTFKIGLDSTKFSMAMRTQCMGHICTHAYRYASICRLGLAACMSDARPRALNARFRSTESAAVDSFENPKIPTPKPVRFTSLQICPKTDFINYNQQIVNKKRTFVLVPHPGRTGWIRRVGSIEYRA